MNTSTWRLHGLGNPSEPPRKISGTQIRRRAECRPRLLAWRTNCRRDLSRAARWRDGRISHVPGDAATGAGSVHGLADWQGSRGIGSFSYARRRAGAFAVSQHRTDSRGADMIAIGEGLRPRQLLKELLVAQQAVHLLSHGPEKTHSESPPIGFSRAARVPPLDSEPEFAHSGAVQDQTIILIILGICSLFAFPMIAIGVHGWLERRRHRRMNRRRQDQHRLL